MCTRKCAGLFVAGLIVVLLSTSAADAQRRGGDRGRGGPPGRGGDSQLDLLGRSDVRDELEIVDEQQEKLDGIRDEMRGRAREFFSGLRDLPEAERREAFTNIREKFGELRKEMDTKVAGVLLPNQVERLKQIAFQSRTRRSGNAGLDNDDVAESLGLTEEQKEKLKEVGAKAQEKLREKIRKLQEETNAEILGVLTPEQREKYKKMAGKPFERREEERRGPRPGGR